VTIEEYLELQKRNREEESKMTPEQREALAQARRRHSKKVRDEILTSYELDQKRKKTISEEE
jgi:hypothetical protein